MNLDWNQLTALPESKGKLSALVVLNLSGNELTSLPRSIGELSALEVLNVDTNQLTSLPESIGELSTLSELGIYLNQIEYLRVPEGILDNIIAYRNHTFCDSLQRITIPNSVSHVPSGLFSDCTSLTRVITVNPATTFDENAFDENAFDDSFEALAGVNHQTPRTPVEHVVESPKPLSFGPAYHMVAKRD